MPRLSAAVRKPKPTNKVSKGREMKFDEKSWQWYFETAEAPGVKWLESVRHIEDLPQAKDGDFMGMLNEYYICGHVIDEPDQDRLPVVPGGLKRWPYSRSRPPPPLERTRSDPVPQARSHPQGWIEPIYHRQPSAPAYASGSAHPVSVSIPPGMPHPDGWRVHSNAPYQDFPQAISSVQEGYPQSPQSHQSHQPRQPHHSLPPLQPPPNYRYPAAPSTRGSRRYDDSLIGPSDDASDYAEDDESYYDAGYGPEEMARERAFIPPPSPKSRRNAQKLRERGYRVADPHDNAGGAEADAAAQKAYAKATRHRAELDEDLESEYVFPPPPQHPTLARNQTFPLARPQSHSYSQSYTQPRPQARPPLHAHSNSQPAFIPPASSIPSPSSTKIDIHRLLLARTTLGIARTPDLVFDLRYDPKHAFDRVTSSEGAKNKSSEYLPGGGGRRGGVDLSTAPAFSPGQNFVRLVIRHPFSGRGGDWVEDIDDARYLTVMDVITIISEMVHRNIDQKLDWEPLSQTDKSFVYEAYLNRPCPDEEATGRRLHLFCEKYMFGGIEQLPPKAKGTTAEGPSFLIKLIKNSKQKRYDRLAGFSVPKMSFLSGGGGTTFPDLADDASSRRSGR